MKKMLLHVSLAVLLALATAAPAAAQATTGGTTMDRTPATGTSVPNSTVPHYVTGPYNGGVGPYGTGAGSTNDLRGYGGFVNGKGNTSIGTNDGVFDRMEKGVNRMGNRLENGINRMTDNDGNRMTTRSANNNTLRTRATTANNDMDWGWLGLLGLIGLAGMFRNNNRERNRT